MTFFPPENAASLIGDFPDWDERPLPLSGAITLEFPAGAYVEYPFLTAQMQPLADEANPPYPAHPWYECHRACSFPGNPFQKPPRPSVLQGTLTEQVISSPAFEQPRACTIYEPPSAPRATLYIQDGDGFQHKLMLHQVADALIAQEAIEPVRLVFLEPKDRVSEYWFHRRSETLFLESVIPPIEQTSGPTIQRG